MVLRRHDFLDSTAWIWLGCGLRQYPITGELKCCAAALVVPDDEINRRYIQITAKINLVCIGPIDCVVEDWIEFVADETGPIGLPRVTPFGWGGVHGVCCGKDCGT